MRTIHGEIEIPSQTTSVTPTEVLVEIEDISRADAPSEVVASLRFKPGELHGGDRIPFVLEVPMDTIDERHHYSLRVHVDMTGSGEIERGDFITVQTYPILTRGFGEKVQVAVRRV